MPKIRHDVQVWPVKKRWQAQCTCNWRGKLHSNRLPAAKDVRKHVKETQ